MNITFSISAISPVLALAILDRLTGGELWASGLGILVLALLLQTRPAIADQGSR